VWLLLPGGVSCWWRHRVVGAGMPGSRRGHLLSRHDTGWLTAELPAGVLTVAVDVAVMAERPVVVVLLDTLFFSKSPYTPNIHRPPEQPAQRARDRTAKPH
jgi:hypothetical protein